MTEETFIWSIWALFAVLAVALAYLGIEACRAWNRSDALRLKMMDSAGRLPDWAQKIYDERLRDNG